MKFETFCKHVEQADEMEVNAMIEFLRARRGRLGQERKNSFSVGDSVQFTRRSGKVIRGSVEKINPKNIIVDGGIDGRFNVSPSFLVPAA